MNSLNAIGRIGRDAETRYTAAGKPVTGWSLAVDVGFGDNKQTLWLDCSLWGERGGKLAEYLKKGEQLGVSGEVGTREHDGKTYVTLNVRDVTLIGGKGGKGAGEQSQRTARSGPAAPPKQSAPADDGGIEDDDIPF